MDTFHIVKNTVNKSSIGGSVKKVFSSLSGNSKRIVKLISFMVPTLGLITAVVLVQQNQDIRDKAAGTQCSDDIDNDGDGKYDYDGYTKRVCTGSIRNETRSCSTTTYPRDPDCSSLEDNSETPSENPSLPPVPETFYLSLTHPNFFPRDGQDYVGKRYLGTNKYTNLAEYQFVKVWSGPLSPTDYNHRQIVYHSYLGWDDKPGKIGEWEDWERKDVNTVLVYRFGSPVANTTTPYWFWNWMNIYQPTKITFNNYKYQCTSSGVSSYGISWPTITTGSSIATSFFTVSDDMNSQPACYTGGGISPNMSYIAVAYRDDYGPPNSDIRKSKCYQNANPIWGRASSAYNICINSPYAGRFDQRYTFYTNPQWFYGCEAVLYTWGYPESGPTHEFFRNGELKWMDYKTIGSGNDYHPYNDESFWQVGCDKLWGGEFDAGGNIYEGIYQVGIGENLYLDKGDNSPPTPVNRSTPAQTPPPIVRTDTWYESCGYQGEQWCQLGSQCDTGWVTGPNKKISCPSNQRLKSTGTLYSNWDGLKRFVGNIVCVDDTACSGAVLSPTPTSTPTSCGANASYLNGSCQCLSYWGNCNSNWSDGCETSLTTKSNCGACGMTCGRYSRCRSGQCVDYDPYM